MNKAAISIVSEQYTVYAGDEFDSCIQHADILAAYTTIAHRGKNQIGGFVWNPLQIIKYLQCL